ncbi:MAG: 30S ribosomal protein S6 [Dehalococcoidales bacterium]|nr:30S ribosomal protein S6 [Dehalococcoidales bacterium]
MARKVREQKTEDKRLQDYELIYIVRPDVAEEAVEARVEGVNQFITGREGVISETQKWGKRKLAYPIKHFLEGNYVLTRFQMSPVQCKDLEANLKISEEILRHLLVKVGS